MRKSLTINDLGAFSNHTFPEMSSKKNIFLLWKKGLTGRAECAILSALWGTSLFITDRTSTKGVKTPRAWRSITASKLRSSSPIGWTHPARPTPYALALPPSVPRPASGSDSAGIAYWAWWLSKPHLIFSYERKIHSYRLHLYAEPRRRHLHLHGPVPRDGRALYGDDSGGWVVRPEPRSSYPRCFALLGCGAAGVRHFRHKPRRLEKTFWEWYLTC